MGYGLADAASVAAAGMPPGDLALSYGDLTSLHFLALVLSKPWLEPSGTPLCSYGVCSYGVCRYGECSYGVCSYGVCNYGVYSYGQA